MSETLADPHGITVRTRNVRGNNPMFFTILLPRSRVEGANVRARVRWAPTTANIGGVKWTLEYTWANIGETYGSPTTISGTSAAGGTAWTRNYTDLGRIGGSGDVLECRLFRDRDDAADTYPDEERFLLFEALVDCSSEEVS